MWSRAAEEGPVFGIPHGECVVAEQVVRAFETPAPVGAQDKRAVRQAAALRVGNSEGGAQRLTVVEPGAGGHREAGGTLAAG